MKIMSITYEIQVEFTHRSTRVKSVDIHPVKPWILIGQYSGTTEIWDYNSHRLKKTFMVTNNIPVRTAKFIPQKEWVVVGSDDMIIRVFDYKTEEKIKEWKAHEDYIRDIVVHPDEPYILSASDDTLIKLWNWENDWECVHTFVGHDHYVMDLAINPTDSNTFATASLDGSAKIWNLHDSNPVATVDAHEKGLNSVNYLTNEHGVFLLTASDDSTAKIWDYDSLKCIKVLEGHSNNANTILSHPHLPLILTGSEDNTIRLWNAVTYNLEKTVDQGLGRAWAIEFVKTSNKIVIGYDEGFLVGNLHMKAVDDDII